MYDFHLISLGHYEMLLLNLGILSLIALALYRGERYLEGRRTLEMMSLLAVFGIAGRILLDPLPNIQPVTTVVLLAGIYYGGWRALALAGTIALTSNVLVLGHGAWTIFQVLGWGVVGFSGAVLSRFILDGDKLMVTRLAFVSAASAFVFDWIVSISILLEAGPSMLLPYLLNGLPFDLYHAAGNIAFVAWLAAPLGDMMLRHRARPAIQAVSELVPN